MKPIFQKDLRENLKIALIGLGLFALLLLVNYQSCIATLTNTLHGNWSGLDDALQPLLSQSLLAEAAFFCAIFGAALGWLQTRNEAHRDLWAFLIHRPVTRTEIFRGKASAGMCLYFFGAGLPVAIFIAVVKMPGHIAAPFEWAMTLPLISIFLTGFAFYFAGMLTGLRQARWFVSRCFGLGLALLAAINVFNMPDFWMSLIFSIMATVILALAASGAYQTGGFYRGLSPLKKLALIISLMAGCGVVMSAVFGLLVSLVLSPFSPENSIYSYYQMTRDGTIYQVTNRNGEITDITSLDGQPLMSRVTKGKMEPKEFNELCSYGGTVNTILNRHHESNTGFYGRSRFFKLWNITDKTLWYLDRHGVLIGFDGRTRQSVGELAAKNGEISEPFLADQYAYHYYSAYNDGPQKLLPSAKSVYRVNFKDRTVQPIFTLTNDDEIGGYTLEGMNHVDRVGERRIFITTRKTVSLLDEDAVVFTVPYAPIFSDYPTVQLNFLDVKRGQTNVTGNRYSLWFRPDDNKNFKSGWKMTQHILWLTGDQKISKSLDLPTLQATSSENVISKLGAALLSPCTSFDRSVSAGWRLLTWFWALAITALGWRLTRRYNFSTAATWGWLTFILIFGIFGLFTFLCVQEWPAREACSGCKKLRCVDRENCEHCNTTFPPPEKNGTEIFAPLETT